MLQTKARRNGALQSEKTAPWAAFLATGEDMTRSELAADARAQIDALTEGNGEENRMLKALEAVLAVAEAPPERVKIEPGDALEWDGLPRLSML